jgi:hypothetical protein
MISEGAVNDTVSYHGKWKIFIDVSNDRVAFIFETSGTVYPTTQSDIPQHLNVK